MNPIHKPEARSNTPKHQNPALRPSIPSGTVPPKRPESLFLSEQRFNETWRHGTGRQAAYFVADHPFDLGLGVAVGCRRVFVPCHHADAGLT